LIVVDRGGGASTQALATDLESLKEWKQIEKRSKKAEAPAVLSDETEVAVRLARDLLMSRELAITATLAMSSPELTPPPA